MPGGGTKRSRAIRAMTGSTEAGALILLAASLIFLIGEIRDTCRSGRDPRRTSSLPGPHRGGPGRDLWRIAARGHTGTGMLVGTPCNAPQRDIARRARRRAAAFGTALLRADLDPRRAPEDRYQAFAPWRTAIPQSAEILWPDPPLVAWFELGRASYWSLYQMAGMVFSRDVTMVSTSRESAVTPILPQLGRALSGTRHRSVTAAPKDAPGLMSGPCRVHGVTFYASWVDLGPTPYPPVAPDDENPQEMLYLYRCSNDRH